MPKQKRPHKTVKRKNLLLRLAVFVFVGYIAIALVQVQIDISTANQELETLQQEVEQQRMRNKELEGMLESQDPQAIVKDRLGLVYPDERVFYDVSGN